MTHLLKQFILPVLALAACITVSSCSDWLDVSSKTQVKYDDMFSSESGFHDQITGIYTKLCSENLYGANLAFGLTDALGQNYEYFDTQNGKYFDVHNFEYRRQNAQNRINPVWSEMYNTIANINILLKALEEHPGVLPEEEEAVYKGECLALRAFCHFDLLRLFAPSVKHGAGEKGIPYVTSLSKEVTPVSTVSEALDKTLSDIGDALLLLESDPMKTGSPSSGLEGTRGFRFNWYAAKALAARVYLYKGDRDKAYECAKTLMQSGKFPWVHWSKVATSSPEQRDRLFTPEIIFALNNTRIKTISESYLEESDLLSMSNACFMTADKYNEVFETASYGFDWRSEYLMEIVNGYYYVSNKYRQLNKDYNNRQPLLRVSEMCLIAAETAPTPAEGADYVNLLRRNRGWDEASLLDTQSVTETQLREIIGKEYRKEFLYEGQWFYWCKRLDLDEIPGCGVKFSKSYYVLPVPDQELEYGNR